MKKVILVLVISLLIFSACNKNSMKDKDSIGELNPGNKNQEAIYCNDTVKVEEDGLVTEFKLVLFAETDGSDNVSTFTGNIFLDYGLDASQITGMGGAPIEGMGGFRMTQYANDVSFDVVKLDLSQYARYGKNYKNDEFVPVPLIKAKRMALLTPNMSGTGNLDITVEGETDSQGGTIKLETGNTTVSGSGPLVMKMYINNGMVTIQIPSLMKAMAYQSFEGILTENQNIIDQARDIANKEFNQD